MTLKNNRAPFICNFKLYASLHSYWWIQGGVTIIKSTNCGKICFDLCDLWSCPARTSILSMLIAPKHFMISVLSYKTAWNLDGFHAVLSLSTAGRHQHVVALKSMQTQCHFRLGPYLEQMCCTALYCNMFSGTCLLTQQMRSSAKKDHGVLDYVGFQ